MVRKKVNYLYNKKQQPVNNQFSIINSFFLRRCEFIITILTWQTRKKKMIHRQDATKCKKYLPTYHHNNNNRTYVCVCAQRMHTKTTTALEKYYDEKWCQNSHLDDEDDDDDDDYVWNLVIFPPFPFFSQLLYHLDQLSFPL